MDAFQKLLDVAERLLGPSGCPWDREQTLSTLQVYFLEEAHELLEAIDLNDPAKISEELGDVLYTLIFIAKLGEKGGLFDLSGALSQVCEKLIRRHPHVFGEVQVSSNDQIIANWEEIKKKEGKKSIIDGIAPTLPALARAQKVIHKMTRAKHPKKDEKVSEGIDQRLWDLVREADAQGINAESALRRITLAYEAKFNAT